MLTDTALPYPECYYSGRHCCVCLAIVNSSKALQPLSSFPSPPVKDQVYSLCLRPKSHPYQLSSYKTQLHRTSLIPRSLFRSVYKISVNGHNLFYLLVALCFLCLTLCSFSFLIICFFVILLSMYNINMHV